jgi:hypothetical protein
MNLKLSGAKIGLLCTLMLPIYSMDQKFADKIGYSPTKMRIAVFANTIKTIQISLDQIPESLADALKIINANASEITQTDKKWEWTMCLVNGIGRPLVVCTDTKSPTYTSYGVYRPETEHDYELVKKLFHSAIQNPSSIEAYYQRHEDSLKIENQEYQKTLNKKYESSRRIHEQSIFELSKPQPPKQSQAPSSKSSCTIN